MECIATNKELVHIIQSVEKSINSNKSLHICANAFLIIIVNIIQIFM